MKIPLIIPPADAETVPMPIVCSDVSPLFTQTYGSMKLPLVAGYNHCFPEFTRPRLRMHSCKSRLDTESLMKAINSLMLYTGRKWAVYTFALDYT